MNNADFVQTFADIVQTINRYCADFHIRVHLALFPVVISGKFPYCDLIFAGLHGIKGTDPCSLPPGALTVLEAGRPREIWQILSSAISGGGHSRHTG